MQNKKYFKIRKRYIPTVWPAYTFWLKMKDVTNVESSIIHLWEKNRLYTGFVDIIGAKERGVWAYNYILKNFKNNLNDLRLKSHSSSENLINECKDFTSNPHDKSLEDYVDFYRKIDELYITYYEDNMLLWIAAEGTVSKKINENLEKYSENEKKEIWDAMSTPTKPSYSNIEEDEFQKLITIAEENGIDSNEFKKLVSLFSEKYIWFPFEYGGPEIYDIKTVTNRVLEKLDKNDIEQTQEINILDRQAEIIKKYSLSQDVVFHFEILQTLALMQDDRKATNSQACYHVNGLVLKHLSELTKISVDLLQLIDVSLLDELSETNDIEQLRKHLEDRDEMFAIYLSEKDDVVFAEGKTECIKLLNKHGISLEDEENTESIKGRGAFNGKVSGTAKLVRKSGECSSLEKGDILITYMTTPDFVPYLDKVSAIVTEEGGITCHAAIVAREMKIPCITGAQNAMSFLKDGDTIEVDAESGIVRLIK